jgi:GMP synthase (glutamine-hydrolysing) A subunit
VNASLMPATPVSSPDIHAHRILILDFGAQYTQLIARRVRESGVYCEIHPWDMSDDDVRAFGARGVILSGGPESVTDLRPPVAPQAVFELGVPVLGICYGMQTMAKQLGGRVVGSTHREFGYAQVTASAPCRLLDGLRDHTDEQGRALLDVWMSHGDRVEELPDGFVATAFTNSVPLAAMADESRRRLSRRFSRTLNARRRNSTRSNYRSGHGRRRCRPACFELEVEGHFCWRPAAAAACPHWAHRQGRPDSEAWPGLSEVRWRSGVSYWPPGWLGKASRR